jgi:hypothetical protein
MFLIPSQLMIFHFTVKKNLLILLTKVNERLDNFDLSFMMYQKKVLAY